eukprot:TRINITY_DN3833_c0_g1_i1.p1 TRINITY_DN3833_c0_g1~~TRINITY_DN3833_c0_g1_i1.p1  ORF type:complete len:676 (-),score=116.80 TRINITY_DN3833_c0_g1_i1:135-2162(-)
MAARKRRVKLYVLDDHGEWADQGTGFAECRPVEDDTDPSIVVSGEEGERRLLTSKVASEDIYAKQAETLIVWNDGENGEGGVDYALSFQETQGCQEIWDEIMDYQVTARQNSTSDLMGKPEYVEQIVLNLPPANLAHLDEIVNLFQTVIVEDVKGKLADLIRENNYIEKLVDLWQMVEYLESAPDFRKMYYIFRELVLLNDPKIIEALVSLPTSKVLMSALEHDPDIVPGQFKHTEFLEHQVQFREVIPFNDVPLVDKIHCVYRLQYLKDVALAKVLDEATNATLASLIFVNNIQVVTRLVSKTKWISLLFDLMKSPEVSAQKLEDALKLLAELTSLSLNLEAKNKVIFYDLLEKNGLFEVCAKTIGREGPDSDQIRLTSMELLVRTVENDSSSLRKYLLSQRHTDYHFLSLLVKRSHAETNTAVLNLLSDVFTNLIGGELYVESVPDDLLQAWTLFYDRFAADFFSPLFAEVPPRLKFSDAESLIRLNLIQSLITFILTHGHRSRVFLLEDHRLLKLMQLLNGRDKFIHLGAVRVIRAVLTINNRFYLNALIEEDIFGPVVAVFVKNGSKYNLLNSAILEMFTFLGSLRFIHPVLKYFLEKYGDEVCKIESAKTIISELRAHYDSVEKRRPNNSFVKDEAREDFRERARAENQEEAWFNDEDSYKINTALGSVH